MTTVLVTGGAGFIGSHVVEELVNRDYDVIVVDNLRTGNLSNLKDVIDNIKFERIDVTDPMALSSVMDGVDVAIHLAAQTNVRYSMECPFDDMETNVVGTLNVAVQAARHDVEKVVYSSSGGAVYGEPEYLPVDEDHPTRPISNYGVSKLAGEHYLRVQAEEAEFDHVILRYANVYGPRQDPSGEAGVISIFLERALKGKPLVVFGDGEQTRDFVYVEDVARVTADCVEKGEGVYNIGTGKETSVNEIIEMIENVVGEEVEVVYDDPRPGEVRRIYLDVSKAESYLGFSPSVDLKEGISRTYEWMKERVLGDG